MAADRYKRVQGSQEQKGKRTTTKKIVISYIYLDRKQGQTFEQWDNHKGRLLRWENIVQHLNTLTASQALMTGVIVKYTKIKVDIHNMPEKSKWKYPKHLNNIDVTWCKIVVMQLVRIIGFLDDNIFYVVFLDENHEFYPTEPKNT